MAALMWIFSGFMVALSLLIYWIAPRVEIIPNDLFVDLNAVKSLSGIKHVEWNDASLLFQGKIIGPESITHDPVTGDIFTGTYDGLVWKINKDLTVAEMIVRTGEDHTDCGLLEYQKVCGRVLGLRFLTGDKLIVVDAYFGIIAIHIQTKTKQVIVQPDRNMNTRSLKIFNSLDVSKEGVVYFTVSSMRWSLDDFIYSTFEAESTGRLYSYSLTTQELKIMASNLSFANGLVISHEGDSLLVAECTKRRILKFDIKEPSKMTIFVQDLIGPIDNIQKGSHGTYFIGIPSAKSLTTMSLVWRYPSLNAWSAWLFPKWMFFSILNFDSNVFQLDGQGNIILVMHGIKNGMKGITEGYEAGDNIIFGSIMNPYLAAVKKKDIALV